MSLNKVGINFSGFDSIPPIDFNISNNTQTFVDEIPVKANEYTGGILGLSIMTVLVIYLFYRLSDKGQVGQFGFSNIRGLGLATGISGVVGVFMYSVGYFVQIYPVIFFIVIFMICFIWVVREEK